MRRTLDENEIAPYLIGPRTLFYASGSLEKHGGPFIRGIIGLLVKFMCVGRNCYGKRKNNRIFDWRIFLDFIADQFRQGPHFRIRRYQWSLFSHPSSRIYRTDGKNSIETK